MTAPGFTPFPNESMDDLRLEAVSDGARLIYYAVLDIATHRARFPGNARALARRLHLLNAPWVERCLQELEDAGVIERYVGLGVMDAEVVVGQVVRYDEYESLPDNRRFDSKIREMKADPYPPPPGVAEKGWSHAQRWAGALERSPSEDGAEVGAKAEGEKQAESAARAEERPKREERERGRARGRTRARAPTRDQMRLAQPIETPAEPPAEIRDAVLAWEAHADELRAKGHPVPQVARADLLEWFEGVAPEVLAAAVDVHIRSEACYWLSPLRCLELRVEWAMSRGDAGRGRRRDRSRSEVVAAGPEVAAEAAAAPETDERIAVVANSDWNTDWAAALVRVRDEMHQRGEQWDFKHWLMPLMSDGVALDGRPVLAAPDGSHANWVREHFLSLIVEQLGYEPIVATYTGVRPAMTHEASPAP